MPVKLEDFRVIIAGSRDFADYEAIEATMDYLLKDIKSKYNIIIVSGAARGADYLGEKYAKDKHYKLEKYPANWNKLGKKAGYVRNVEMAEVADACAIFCVNESKGSMHMYDICIEKNIQVDISHFYTNDYLNKHNIN